MIMIKCPSNVGDTFDYNDGTVISSHSYGNGGGPIYLSNVLCTGSELNLLSCSYSTPNGVTPRQDIGVQCLPGNPAHMTSKLAPTQISSLSLSLSLSLPLL